MRRMWWMFIGFVLAMALMSMAFNSKAYAEDENGMWDRLEWEAQEKIDNFYLYTVRSRDTVSENFVYFCMDLYTNEGITSHIGAARCIGDLLTEQLNERSRALEF